MTLLATMQGFFTHHLIGQRRASPHTVASYRDTMRLLLRFAHTESGKTPSQLDLGDLDAKVIGRFLDHLEHDRHNSVNTRNNRLAAIHSLFAYAAFGHPDHAEVIARVLAIPPKKTDRRLVSFLTDPEVEALIAAPDRETWTGRRDHAMITTAITTGLRVSELAAITIDDLHLGVGAHIRCHGKGRKERITPLTGETIDLITVWLLERRHSPGVAVFPSRRGNHLTRDAISARITLHTRIAASYCRSITTKNVTPHTLRHTCAMRLLAVGIETSVIALWLGHESSETTQIYLHADLTIKERAIARTAPIGTKPGRYRAPDKLLAFLESR